MTASFGVAGAGKMVVREVFRNVEKKLPGCLAYYHRLFKTLPFEVADPTDPLIKTAKELISEKDAVILAAALNGKIDYLASLDKHFLAGNLEMLPFTICAPADLLNSVRLE